MLFYQFQKLLPADPVVSHCLSFHDIFRKTGFLLLKGQYPLFYGILHHHFYDGDDILLSDAVGTVCGWFWAATFHQGS